ncbi:MAG: hypothetical protein GY856_34775 [bacterium]|nr:hypothetical protein [bacterium]
MRNKHGDSGIIDFVGLPQARELAGAFRRAARALAAELPPVRVFDAVPILFLYRHAVTFYVDAILEVGERLRSVPAQGLEERVPNLETYGLTDLPKTLQQALEAAGWSGNPDADALRSFADLQRFLQDLEGLAQELRSQFAAKPKRESLSGPPDAARLHRRMDSLMKALDLVVTGLEKIEFRTEALQAVPPENQQEES